MLIVQCTTKDDVFEVVVLIIVIQVPTFCYKVMSDEFIMRHALRLFITFQRQVEVSDKNDCLLAMGEAMEIKAIL